MPPVSITVARSAPMLDGAARVSAFGAIVTLPGTCGITVACADPAAERSPAYAVSVTRPVSTCAPVKCTVIGCDGMPDERSTVDCSTLHAVNAALHVAISENELSMWVAVSDEYVTVKVTLDVWRFVTVF